MLRAERACLLLLWLAVAGYVFLFLKLTFRLYDRFTIMAYDLGIFDQALWLISHGRTPFVTVRGLPILADHFSAILYLLTPLYWLWPDARALMLAQTLALASGALPLYALTRLKTGSPVYALLFAVAYLCYPAMQWTNAFEFHAETFATPLFLAAFLFLMRRQWGPYFAMLVLAALTKETVGLTIIALGVYAFFKADRRVGVGTIALGGIGLVAALATVRYFNHGEPSPFFALYARFGHSPGQVVLFALEHPIRFGAALTTRLNRWYLFQLLFPLLFMVLLAPEVLAIALPALLANMLSSRFVMHTIAHQYTAFITPFIFLAAVIGFDRARQRGTAETTRLMLAYLILWMGLETIGVGGIKSPLRVWAGRVRPGLVAANVPEVRGVVGQIPPQASVSAQAALMVHMTHRPQAYAFPNPFIPLTYGYGAHALLQMEQKDRDTYTPTGLRQAFAAAPVEYVALCPRTTTYPVKAKLYPLMVTAALQSPAYGIVSLGRNTVLLRRGADHQRGLKLLEQQTGRPVRTDQDVAVAFRAWTRHTPFSI